MHNRDVPTVHLLLDAARRLWLGPVLGVALFCSAQYFETRDSVGQAQIENAISTNVDNLSTIVGWSSLLTSLLVPASDTFFFVVLVTVGVSACQWFVGPLRSLFAYLMGNILATLVLFPVLLVGVNAGWLSESARYAHDYGVSYAVMSVLACTAMLPRTVWARVAWWAITILALIPFEVTSFGTYTMYGHLIATGVGVLLGWFYRRNPPTK